MLLMFLISKTQSTYMDHCMGLRIGTARTRVELLHLGVAPNILDSTQNTSMPICPLGKLKSSKIIQIHAIWVFAVFDGLCMCYFLHQTPDLLRGTSKELHSLTKKMSKFGTIVLFDSDDA